MHEDLSGVILSFLDQESLGSFAIVSRSCCEKIEIFRKQSCTELEIRERQLTKASLIEILSLFGSRNDPNFHLKVLDLSGLRIDAEIMNPVTQIFPNLKELYLHRCSLKKCGLVYLLKLNQLQLLDMGYTRISEYHLEILKNLNYLSILDLSCTQISGEGLKILAECSQLRELSLRGAKILAFDHLSKLGKLENLDLQDIEISTEDMHTLYQLSHLRCLQFTVSKVDRDALSLLQARVPSLLMVAWDGIEPPTHAFSGRCSTD